MAKLLDPRLNDPHLLTMAAMRLRHRRAQTVPASASACLTDDQLWQYVFDTWGVQIPRLAVCPGHVAPFTAFADAYFARDSMHVWESSRGFGGKSMLLSLLGLTIATTRGGDVNILGGSGEQSRRVLEYMGKAWDAPQAPRHLLASDPHMWRTRLKNGSTLQALLASSTSVRGPHTSTLLLDEIDEFELRLFDASMGQTMAEPGRPAVTVMSSTHQYPEGVMSVVKRRAGESGWLQRTWCLEESLHPHGWLDPAEVERKQREVTATMWQTEFLLQQPSSQNRAIDPDAVTACFRRELGAYEGRPREYVEVEAPDPRGTYAHGADWARKVDMTEIVTLRTDVTPYRLVAYERMQRQPWPQMVGRFDARITRYAQGQPQTFPLRWKALFDATGLGDVIGGYLAHDAEAFVMAGRARADLFAECVAAIERGDLVAPWIAALEAQLRYCSVDDLYGAGHPPDGFVALACAYRAAKPRMSEKRVGVWGT